jgi:uroporphyrinogen-III synthase
VTESLGGARVALLEARRESELASLVRRHGGEPICVPALREVERDCQAEVVGACEAIEAGDAVAVFTTGVGLERVLRRAGELGRGESLRAGIARATVVCRGPKPIAVLKREGLPVHVRAESPHTTDELRSALASVPVEGRTVVFVHDGGGHTTVLGDLERRGARVIAVQPYEWALPLDVEPLRALVRTILGGGIDVLAITTQVQARHLFAVADSLAARAALVEALSGRVLVAAVGPTSVRALAELGVAHAVVPEQPKMGPMVAAIAKRLAK